MCVKVNVERAFLTRHLAATTTIIFLAFTILLSICTPITRASAEQEHIDTALSSINQALKNVLIAEKLGENVTQLLVKLNNAGALLSEAANTYRSGSTANVTSMAENARLLAEQVSSDAISLQTDSSNRMQIITIQNFLFSSIGASAFVIILVFFWIQFKKNYIKKMLNSKPETVKDAN